MSEQYQSPPPPPPPGGYQGGPPGGYQGGYSGGYQGGPPPAKPANVLAIVALVAGIIAFFTGLVPVLGLLLGIAAVVLGVLGLRKARALYGSGKGLAITALILGSIAAITSLGTTALAGVIGASDTSTTSSASAPATSEPAPSESAPAPEESAAAPAEPAPEQSSAEPAPAAGQFPGQTADDQVAQPGSPVTIGGLTITTTPLAAQSDIFGQSYCTTVSYQNSGQDSESYNLFDWNVLNPNGASESATITGADGQLSSGDLAPGGNVGGLVCFKDTSVAPGTNVVLYEAPSLFSTERGAWINQVG